MTVQLQVARQQVAALNTQPGAPGQAPGLAPAPGVAAAGSASSGARSTLVPPACSTGACSACLLPYVLLS